MNTYCRYCGVEMRRSSLPSGWCAQRVEDALCSVASDSAHRPELSDEDWSLGQVAMFIGAIELLLFWALGVGQDWWGWFDFLP